MNRRIFFEGRGESRSGFETFDGAFGVNRRIFFEGRGGAFGVNRRIFFEGRGES